jgi:hypothetical protein
MKRECTVMLVGELPNIDAIQAEDVEVHIHAECRIHALHRSDGASQSFFDSRQSEQLLRSPFQRALQLLDDVGQDFGTQLLFVPMC